MTNHILVNLVDSVLGKGKHTSGDNYSYHCPFCNHPKRKLEVNFAENEKGKNNWHCWVCNAKGTRLSTLFKKIPVSSSKLDELGKYVKIYQGIGDKTNETILELPIEFISLDDPDTSNMNTRKALKYLKNRGINSLSIKRYNIGYCDKGQYSDRVVIPSYDDEGNLNFFTTRSFTDNPRRYKNPKVSRDIIPFANTINWHSPIILCEGVFDAIAIKRNAIPLLGKTIPPKLIERIVSDSVRQVFIALDNDALKQALEYCETLMNLGKEVFLINLEQKDPSNIGFKEFTKLLHKSKPLTFKTLLKQKFLL